MSEARPLHLHTVESVCSDLISGRAIAINDDGETFQLERKSSRALLGWYVQNRRKWAGNVQTDDLDVLAKMAGGEPPVIPGGNLAVVGKKRALTLVKVEAHRFGGLHAFSDGGAAPPTFVFEPTKPITLLEGWNGSGKTSILNAIIWCLTGQLLRPQREPEETNAEYACRIKISDEAEDGEFKLTPVSPLPDSRYVPDPNQQRVPLDTWVEMTFSDEAGVHLAPVRRTQRRTKKGVVEEIPADLQALGLDPIAARIGTAIPGLLPFIQIGGISEFGQAIAQLTGLADLVNLAKHAGKVKLKLEKDHKKTREAEIEQSNQEFREARDKLQNLIAEMPKLAPSGSLPDPLMGAKIEEALKAATDHFTSLKTLALENAKQVLGTDFDPSIQANRQSLEDTVAPARQQLKELSKLASASRLISLGNLTREQIAEAEQLVEKIRAEAQDLAELVQTPDLARRRQLYARVADWMKAGEDEADFSKCKVCGGSLEDAWDATTGQPVRRELEEALKGDAELISQTVPAWVDSRLGKMSNSLPQALAAEMRRDLPSSPVDLLLASTGPELFQTEVFGGVLSVLRSDTEAAAKKRFTTLPEFERPKPWEVPVAIATATDKLEKAISRVRIAIAFADWKRTHGDVVKAAIMDVLSKSDPEGSVVSAASSLGAKLAALAATVEGARPINQALGFCADIQKQLTFRREKEAIIASYAVAAEGLADVIAIGDLAQAQVEALKQILDRRARHWRSLIYNNAYATSGHKLVESGMDSKGALSIYVGSGTVSAPAQHVSNASALRATLVGFFLAFWEYVHKTRGGLKLLVLDDPQELLDEDNRDRLARALVAIHDVGAQLIVTTHNRAFARLSVSEGRKRSLIEHRSVHPVNASIPFASTVPATEEIDLKRADFEKHAEDAGRAQDYVAAVRTFMEVWLGDVFDDPAYPMFSTASKAPTLADFVGRLRGLATNPPNELFRSKPIKDFCDDPSLKDGSSCLILLNKAHHGQKQLISYNDVYEQAGNLKRLRACVEDVHAEFRRWKWREQQDAVSDVLGASLKPATFPLWNVRIHPDLAAFTSQSSYGESQEEEELLSSSWFEGKSLFYLRNENMGFAAPATSIVVVESDAKPGNDRNLVIARLKGETLARRLFRNDGNTIVLAAQTPNPRKSPPTRVVDPGEVAIHRVLGVLFDDLPPPQSKREAAEVPTAPCLSDVVVSYRVRNDSALPLALPGQIVLGGKQISPSELGAYEGRYVALVLTDGSSIFKRIGPTLPGLPMLRQFESIGGLGASEVILTEEIEGSYGSLRVMAFARLVLGIIYE